MLDLIAAWLRDPSGAAARLEQPGLVDACAALGEFITGRDWTNDLEPTLRLGACLHAYVLDGDARVASIRDYYRTVDGDEDPAGPKFEADLARAILALGPALVEEASEWRVRTNETSRGIVWLLPACLVGAEAVHLIEFGASAGLNLYAERRSWTLEWDDGTSARFGQAVDDQFRVKVGGDELPPLPDGWTRGPEVLSRVGSDADPVDAADPATARVLAACVWGDQARRLRRMREGLETHARAVAGEIEPVARVMEASLPDDITTFLEQALPRNPEAPIISFNTYVTAYLNDVDHRAMERRISTLARAWSLQHHLPWMWVRFEPPRSGEVPGPEPGWCRWRVDLWEGARHHRIELGWAHPHLVRAQFGPGLLALAELRDSE